MSNTFDPNTPAAATPAVSQPTSTPAAVSPAPATPSASVTPTTQATPTTPAEDRSNWVPPYRLRETTTKYEQAIAAERARFQAEREALERKLQVLAGVVPTETNPYDEIRNQFKQVMPELAEIGSQAEAIKELLALKDQFRQTVEKQWHSHNRTAMDGLYKAAEATYGQPLSEEAKRALGSAFVGYLQSNPDAYERYQEDPSVATEYWSQFTERFINPIQRNATVQSLNRLPGNIPQDSHSNALPVSQAPKPATQDERLDAALAHYKAKLSQGF